jgi:hypothetical protein
MAYDERVAQRIRDLVVDDLDVTEKRMFGGLAFLIDGHLAVCASGQGDLLLRVEPSETDELAARPHARQAEMRGRAMAGWLRVAGPALGDDELGRWVSRGVGYVRTLPPK